MECNEFEKLIIPYLTDDEFSDELGDQFEQHYLSCDECWDKFERDLKLISFLKEKTVFGIVGREPEVDRDEELLEYADALIKLGNFPEAKKCLEEALELRPWDEEIEARIAEAGLGKESIEVYINGVAIDEFTVSGNKLFVELYRGGNARDVRVVVKYLDPDDYFFVDLPHNDITYYDLAASTEETKEGEGKILEISSKKEKDASSKIILIDAIYRKRVPYKVVFDKDTDCADLVVDLV
jgi:tetratricopeptide (TPR) repeat protein